jgi:hypothetical protein
MPNPDEPSRSRAEARRRARLAARGELPEEEAEPIAEPEPERGGFLRRIFPPVPPLPDKPDPLKGRDFRGVGGWIAERVFLLRINPLVWLIPAALWFVSQFVDRNSAFGLVSSLLAFAGLIGAGWFGWQRPTLYGTVAAVLGFSAFATYVLFFFSGEGASEATLQQIAFGLTGNLVLQAVLGFVSGWYGGYLRRRQAQLRTDTRGRR